jgi:hypothetical protein
VGGEEERGGGKSGRERGKEGKGRREKKMRRRGGHKKRESNKENMEDREVDDIPSLSHNVTEGARRRHYRPSQTPQELKEHNCRDEKTERMPRDGLWIKIPKHVCAVMYLRSVRPPLPPLLLLLPLGQYLLSSLYDRPPLRSSVEYGSLQPEKKNEIISKKQIRKI